MIVLDNLRGSESYFARRGWNGTDDYLSAYALFSIDNVFPSTKPFYFTFEREFDAISWLFFTRKYYWMAPLGTILYLLFICVGPRIMASKKPYDLQTPLRYWNLFLTIFSFWGMIRMAPHISLFIWKVGFTESLCVPPVWNLGTGPAGLWMELFVYSKFVELIDTVFIVLRKRKLNFLHWYHHATVLIFAWDAFVVEQPPGIYFCVMNYAVHSVMYFYYYLAAVMKKPPKWGIIVTIMQIAQMFGGLFITALSLVYAYRYPYSKHISIEEALRPFNQSGCYLERTNLWGSMAIYATYLYLFAAFFIERYLSKRFFPKDKITKQE